ncbi:hypothetical protein [Bacillus amyloliquefaciens]|uniref:hypothetical protein n=1 Tax=Bacillus amyloliquefaciens TaxID=1390 RepID=UPI001580F6F1|nr:hypothetical protein [Bacillus amyloliquefaciens]NUI22598.1 hypothetical protein [Bacillus amyloliquefaciens]NUI31678.1 hypothetical protein [Bacillus amyloliquefaciens]NUI35291.1 hypothetical protein [Bacillus amyloliquefaciens]NUI69138.1 hypothetical protein [Bacillus amyloliquefaciens]NUI72663.1 hypothetical protein [Bacillus amyloliquefaciens]
MWFFYLIIIFSIVASIIVFGNKLIIGLMDYLERIGDTLFIRYQKYKTGKSNIIKLDLASMHVIEIVILVYTVCYFILSLLWFAYSDVLLYILIFTGASIFLLILFVTLGRIYRNIKDEFEKNNSKYTGFMEPLINFIYKNKFLYPILKFISGRTGKSLYIHLLFLIIVLSYLTLFYSKIPIFFQYIFLMTIPFALVSWVYLTPTDKTEQGVRRIIVYILLVILVAIKSYSYYKITIGVDRADDVMEFFYFLLLTVFTALDRVFKTIFDELNNKKKKVYDSD